MRPIQLVINAFGSYGKKETIDFTKAKQNIFLITGITGSGKSTIFDAIVFALYGEASSENNKKDGQELQSQFVDLKVEPYVELRFEEKGEEYTVRRSPRHDTGKKTRASEKVTLTMPDLTEYPQKEVDKKLVEIVGLTKQQFMQVAMIAQGEFMEMLRAKTPEKKEMFRKLFDTELYYRIVDELNNRLKDKNKEISEIRTICQNELGRLNIPENYEDYDRIQNLKNNIMKSETLSVIAMEEMQEAISVACAKLTEEWTRLQDIFEEAEIECAAKNTVYDKAEALLSRFHDLESAQKELDECKALEDEITQKKELVARISDAYEVKDVYAHYVDAKRRFDDTKQRLEEKENELPKLIEQFEKAKEEEKECNKAYEEESERCTEILTKADADIEKLKQIDEFLKKETEAAEAFNVSQEENKKIKVQLDELEKNEKNWKEDEKTYQGSDVTLQALENKEKEGNEVSDLLEDLNKKKTEIHSQQEKLENERKVYLNLRQECDEIRKEYEEKRNQFLDNQAGVLAETLVEGKPCPVCGSVEHPGKHIHKETVEVVTKEVLDELEKQVKTAEENQNSHSESIRARDAVLAEKIKTSDEQKQRIIGLMQKGKMGVVSEEESEEQLLFILHSWFEMLRTEKKACRENVMKLQTARENLLGVSEQRDAFKKKLEETELSLKKCTEEKMDLESTLRTLKKDLHYKDIMQAEGVKKEAEEKKKSFAGKYERAKAVLSEGKTMKEEAETLIGKYKEEIPKLSVELEEKQSVYEAKLVEKGMTEIAWKECVAGYSRDTGSISSEIEKFAQRKSAAQAMAEVAKKETVGKEKPNMEELLRQKQEAESRKKEAQLKSNEMNICVRDSKDVYTKLCDKMETRKVVMEQHSKLSTLYNRLAGKESGARMDLETYAQRYYLKRILDAANDRFREMTADQFELRMYDVEEAGEGKNRGLDLMVYSRVTQKQREVRTLSGGESFMAALSLALGMADMIQDNSAAVSLDMMFIDEGFGSLDDLSRAQAIKVLKDMAYGSKLIGIISHVSELKQEIDDQLIVTKDDNGSSVKWQLS